MNLEAIERGLDWLTRPKYLPGRLEMDTQRGRRWEMEIVSFAISVPIAGAKFRIPLFMLIMPVGSSPIKGSPGHAQQGDH